MSDTPKPKRVDPQLLYGLSLLGGLALSWPSLASAMRGETDIIAAGIRLLLSISIVWIGAYFITSLIGGYAAGIEAPEPAPDPREPQRVLNTAMNQEVGGAMETVSTSEVV